MPSNTPKRKALVRDTPLTERISVNIAQAAALTGLSLSHIEKLVYSGLLKSQKVGKSRIIEVKHLRAMVETGIPIAKTEDR